MKMMMDNNMRESIMEIKVSMLTKLAYAMGHIFNDLAAAMWFSYTLIYLQRVALLKPITAGALLLLGQVVDALMTPIFGFLVDRYYKKKHWHVFGSMMVAFNFPIIFEGLANSSSSLVRFLYVMSIVVFQAGWAAVQISHLSMIPSLTNSMIGRADLTAIRYSAQVGSAVIVYVITWIILPASGEAVVLLDQHDAYKFRNIVLILTGIGLVATMLFHIFLKEHLLDNNNSRKMGIEESTRLLDSSPTYRKTCVGSSILLRVAMLYVASRLFITLATVYLPLYIEETAVGGKQALATVPLVSYLSSFVAALLLKYISRSCGTKICYLLGALIGISSALIVQFGANNNYVIYAVAVLIGAGSSITMVTALSVTAEIIGPRTESSALVYSIVTFLDKVITGLVVVLIERWRCHEEELCPNYNRDTLSILCATSMMLGLVTLLSVWRCLT